MMIKRIIITCLIIAEAGMAYSQSTYGKEFYLFHSSKNQSKEIMATYGNDSMFCKDDLMDLSLSMYPNDSSRSDYFVILIPGDGGWMDFTTEIAAACSHRGIPVVGFSTVPYFIERKTPKQVAGDIQRVIRNFSHVWHKKKVILAGYSFGAEIMPFIYNALDKEYKKKVIRYAIIAASNEASFWVSPDYNYRHDQMVAVVPELGKTDTSKLLIICDNSKESLCKYLPGDRSYDVMQLPVGHAFGGKWNHYANVMLDKILVR